MTIQKQIDLLKRRDLSTDEFQTILNTIHSTLPLSDSDSLALTTILLHQVLPQTYTLMDINTRTVTSDILCSKVSLSQIIKIIKDDIGRENMRKRYICFDLFCSLVDNIENLVENFIQYKGTDYDAWKSLLSIKIMDTFGYMNVLLLNHPSSFEGICIEREKVKKCEEIYVSKIATTLIHKTLSVRKFETLNCTRQTLSYLFSVVPKEMFYIVLNNWKNWKNLYTIRDGLKIKQIRLLKDSQKSTILGMLNAINAAISVESMVLYRSLIANISKDVDLLEFNNLVMRHIIGMKLEMEFIWLRQVNETNMTYIYDELKKFGTKNFMLNTPVNDQKNLMNHILVYLHFLDKGNLKEISESVLFLEVISTRLESTSPTLRQMGMFVADFVYLKCNNKYLFDVKEYSKERDELFKNLSTLHSAIDETLLCDNIQEIIEKIFEDLSKPEKNKVTPKNSHNIVEVSPLMVDLGYNSDEDDSDLDDMSVSKKPNVAKPVFLKDLVYYMTCDPQKDASTYEKRTIAFSIGIEMVRLKKNTPELTYYCTKLIDAGLDIDSIGFPSSKNTDEDDIKEAVESWRVSFLVALCTSVPDLAFKYLIEGFLTNDWNFTLKIQALTVLGLSCRELSGEDDKFILGKNKLFDLHKLPQYSHDAFLDLDPNHQKKKVQDLSQEEREQKLVKALELADISSGNVVYRSRKLDIDHGDSSKVTIQQTKRTTFINKSLPKIFFTMVSVWQEINTLTQGRGFLVGSLSDHLNSHFLDIISMIYICGVPNCIELHEMSREFIFCICGALQIVQESSNSEFSTKIFLSCVKSIHSLLAENERILIILKNTASTQIATLLELYTQVLSSSPPIDEPLRSVSTILLQQLQQLSVLH